MPPLFFTMNIRDRILGLLGAGVGENGEGRLFAELRVAPTEKKEVKKILRALEKEGAAVALRQGWTTPERLGAVKGKVRANARGFAFVMPENSEIYHDFFIPKHSLNGAYDGDTVLCAPVKGTADEGRIIKILERGLKKVVGVFERAHGAGRVIPDNPREPQISIPSSLFGGAKSGDKVVATVTAYPAGGIPFGKVSEILGKDGDFSTEELAIIKSFGLKEEFSAAAEAEAKEAANRPISGGRRDLRGLCAFTIDGEDTRDMDDAVSIEEKDGKFILGVHIADVSEYVACRGKLDGEAYARGTSVYFPDRTLPMLPLSLSNGACSLAEGEDRAAVSVFVTYAEDGERLGYEIVKSVIRSKRKTAYGEISALLDGDGSLRGKYKDILPSLESMRKLCLLLEERQKRAGAVDLDLKEVKIILDGDKIVVPDSRRTISERIIEQFMIAANRAVAEFLGSKKLPCLYRVHDKPSAEKSENFAAFISGLGITPAFDCENVKPADFTAVLKQCEGKEFEKVAAKVMLRSMQKAVYSEINRGHFGLAVKDYCHFTSPIRRYPDLFVHRVLSAALAGDYARARAFGENIAENGKHLSICERTADEAERETDKLYILKYMSDKIGEEYDAVISGVTSFGVFCELANTVEGFIPLEDLPRDGYELYEDRYELAGRKYAFRLGDGLKIRVSACDYGARRVLFALA